jgi:DNA repair exonuclease SbcCD ATPase subunit
MKIYYINIKTMAIWAEKAFNTISRKSWSELEWKTEKNNQVSQRVDKYKKAWTWITLMLLWTLALSWCGEKSDYKEASDDFTDAEKELKKATKKKKEADKRYEDAVEEYSKAKKEVKEEWNKI